jgi:hypothetical protein
MKDVRIFIYYGLGRVFLVGRVRSLFTGTGGSSGCYQQRCCDQEDRFRVK